VAKNDFKTAAFLHYLKINEEFDERSDASALELPSEQLKTVGWIAKVHLVNSLPYFEVTYMNVWHSLIANFYKAYLLFEFLEGLELQ